jgi:hypothetical protein
VKYPDIVIIELKGVKIVGKYDAEIDLHILKPGQT